MNVKKTDWLGGIACVAAGILIAALPHFIAWSRTGRPDYVATADDRYYLAIGSQALFNHPSSLADPVKPEGGVSQFRPLPLLPGLWAARALQLDPLGIGLMWRVLAGAMVGLAWYMLFRLKIEHVVIAAGLTLIMLSDVGLINGTPIIRLLKRAQSIAFLPGASLLPGGHWIHLEWRSITPATTMFYLIASVWAVLRARQSPTCARIAIAGLAFGLLFHVYFYYWTAVGLALLVALVLDTGFRRVYFHIGWIGALIGFPVVVSDFLLKRGRPDDWLIRIDKFVKIGRLTELTLPPEILVVAVLGLGYVLLRRRDLIFVWALAVAGLLLQNHQVVTGLQLDNFHWSYVWGPAFCCFILMAVAVEFEPREGWSNRACTVVGLVATLAFGVGLWIRGIEATRCTDPVANARAIAAYRSEISDPGSPRFAPNAVAAGDSDFVDYAAILSNLRPLSGWSPYNSASITDAELDDREALNAVILSVDRSSFEGAVALILRATISGHGYAIVR